MGNRACSTMYKLQEEVSTDIYTGLSLPPPIWLHSAGRGLLAAAQSSAFRAREDVCSWGMSTPASLWLLGQLSLFISFANEPWGG